MLGCGVIGGTIAAGVAVTVTNTSLSDAGGAHSRVRGRITVGC
jgi:hypothetical protein